MSNHLRDLIDREADLDDEEDDASFDDEDEPRRRKHIPDDSSEEEEDDDEEEEKKIREGFIVDDEDDEEEEGSGSDAAERPVKRKRPHRDREELEQLDEDDLDLIGEQLGDWKREEAEVRSPVADGQVCMLLTLGSPSSND
jgi:transcription elongation factor SPT6